MHYLILLICLIQGTTWVAIKYSLEGFPPFMGVILRFSIAAVLLFGFLKIRGISLRIPRRSIKILAITAVLLYPVNFGLMYWAEQHINSGITAVFFSTYPIFTGIFSVGVVRAENFSIEKLVGLLLGFSGVTITFFEQFQHAVFNTIMLLAAIAIITGASAAALSIVIVKKHLSNVQPAVLGMYQMVIGIPILGIISILSGESTAVVIPWESILATIYLGAIPSALGFGVYYFLLNRLSPITLSYVHYVNPMLALFTGWLILNEPLTMNMLYGTLIVLCGVATTKVRIYWNAMKVGFVNLVR
ncbi:MAG: EamA family transporter [Candidatus Marinimicrobia bacterium]|nr:EamA family transporter [Candidatus Neomarinimicrobiota bacterium]